MSDVSASLSRELVHRIRAGWQQAVAHAIRGDVDGATAALDGVQHGLTMLVEQANTSSRAFDPEMLQQLLDEHARAIGELETALGEVEAALGEVRAQRQALKSARLAVNRLLPQPRWVDERV